MFTLLHLHITLFSPVLTYSSAALVQYELSELWRRRTRDDVQLFPTLSSPKYPTFAGFPHEGGVSRVHMTADDVKELSTGLNDTEVVSVCSYDYLGSTFYVVNTGNLTDYNVEVSLNLTLTELENMTEEMILRSMKPSHICRGSDGLHQVVWRGGSEKYLRHFIVQEGEIKSILSEDTKYGQRGYYPSSIQVYRSENQTTALIVWEKGYGVKYRIQSGSDLSEMEFEMARTDMKPSVITGLPGRMSRYPTKYFVVWRTEEFAWAGRAIPRAVAPGLSLAKNTKLDQAIEEEMRSFEIPSLSICVYRSGQTIWSVSYGFSDLRNETRAAPRNSYRIASISKTITAMGIAELINRRHINLDSKVFGTRGILSWLDVSGAHPWLRAVTVRHLLEHSSGGWCNQEKLEFNKTPQTERLNGTALLDFYIRSYEPRFQPGTRYLYSNIAYVFLGKIIEQVTLSKYSDFIQDVILKPNKIEAQIGDVDPGVSEVSYYSPDNANPYTYWSPTKLDAAAGWVMRAEEVARLFALLESHKRKWYWILVQPSAAKQSYGRGVQLGDDGSLYHIGSLAGSEAIGYSRGDTQVAILTNTRGREQAQHTAWMERLCRLFAAHVLP